MGEAERVAATPGATGGAGDTHGEAASRQPNPLLSKSH